MMQKAEERTLWRIRLLVARAAQDCGAMHHQLHELGAVLDEVIEAGRISADTLAHIEKLSDTIASCADDCRRHEHCEFVRADLACELRELDSRLRDSIFERSMAV